MKQKLKKHRGSLAIISIAVFFMLALIACENPFLKCMLREEPAAPQAAVKPVTGVTLNKSALTLIVNAEETLTATVVPADATNRAVTWSSSNNTIASVDSTGKVRGKTAGTAVITVKTKDGNKTATCTVTVKAAVKPVTGVTLNKTTLTLIVNAEETLIATVIPADATNTAVTWSSSNNAIASVDATGKVTGKTAGTAIITVETVDGNFTATCTVTVEPKDKTYTVGSVSFTMKGIDAVTNGLLGHADYSNNPVHTASISAYRIGETEVTQELWQAVMGNNPSYFQGTGKPPAVGETQAKRPVEMVNWYQAIAFCNKLSLKCGLECCYTVSGITDWENLAYTAIPTGNNTNWNNAVLDLNKNGFRLPTEAEWEWAAKGGTEYKWAGTDTQSELINYAWYGNGDGGDSGGKTHEVKKKQPNGYGLYDMSGNVWEWCWDWRGGITAGADLGQDYTGASSGAGRVRRGGDWFFTAGRCFRSFRDYNHPGIAFNYLGLRLACRP